MLLEQIVIITNVAKTNIVKTNFVRTNAETENIFGKSLVQQMLFGTKTVRTFAIRTKFAMLLKRVTRFKSQFFVG